MTIYNDLQKELQSLKGVSDILHILSICDEAEEMNLSDVFTALDYLIEELTDCMQAKLDASLDDQDPVGNYITKKKEALERPGRIHEHLSWCDVKDDNDNPEKSVIASDTDIDKMIDILRSLKTKEKDDD